MNSKCAPSAPNGALEALANAIALPDAYSQKELSRTLCRNQWNVMKAASQLIEKHQFRQRFGYDSLDIRSTRIQSELKKGYVHYLENATNMEKCPIILLQLKFFKPQFTAELKTIARGEEKCSEFTSLEDARRLCVYLTDLAVQSMEDNNANGVVFMIDAEECSLQQHFLETRMFTDLLQTMRTQYPEIVQHIFILNCNAITRSLIHMLIKTQAADRTQLRVRLVTNFEDLKQFIGVKSIPVKYGGQYKMMTPLEWIKVEAEIEGVQVQSDEMSESEAKLMNKNARLLNGMQYAACSVDHMIAMKATGIRGPLYRLKSDSIWMKMYAVLRPEAVLLYENATGKMPHLIIPVNTDTKITATHFPNAPRGSSGFRMDVPGVVGGHLLSALSEPERANWLKEIQSSIEAFEAEIFREQLLEENRHKDEASATANLISFDDWPIGKTEYNPVGIAPTQVVPITIFPAINQTANGQFGCHRESTAANESTHMMLSHPGSMTASSGCGVPIQTYLFQQFVYGETGGSRM
uniref:Uncharacterized protein AlNc14C40G3447 n=1 Tax=Albugo laibachii Nc14 TaxID=890382 RepID=F0W9I8_9STRA|nr:conserved hypothetical protein [Albugo laibachii Nc14]|eukprot:CCA17802.1 conserved hypothetical protein [Albugo laibachii Nc14]